MVLDDTSAGSLERAGSPQAVATITITSVAAPIARSGMTPDIDAPLWLIPLCPGPSGPYRFTP